MPPQRAVGALAHTLAVAAAVLLHLPHTARSPKQRIVLKFRRGVLGSAEIRI